MHGDVPIPDAWPPPMGAAVTVPMFPLRGVFLLPRQVLPLHVFEPRYRQLIEDVLDEQGRLVLATVLDEQPARPARGDATDPTGADAAPGEVTAPAPAPPRVLPIAGLGEIARHDKTPDGRYFIWLFGVGRHALEEVESDRLYRRVRARPLQELDPSPKEARALSPRLREALASRSEAPLDLPSDIPLAVLADSLSSKLHLPQAAMEPIFCELDVARRAALVLEAHEAFPPPRL
ncbi:MAG: LON peptidase substrate-binding domain-containing protein [Planctomycetota bacterium]